MSPICPLLFALAAAQEPFPIPEPISARKASFGIYAAEAGGGIALAGLGLACSGLLALGYWGNNEGEAQGATTILFVASPILGLTGCAGGTCIAGSAFGQNGRFLPALAHATVTAALGVGLWWGGTRLAYYGVIDNYHTAQAVGWPVICLGIGTIAATPVAAVYGYNRSRPPERVGGRFVPGSVALGTVRDSSGDLQPTVDFCLVGFRF